MDATDGLTRGQVVTDTGSQIRMPVGPKTLGRILNVIGEPIDELGPVGATETDRKSVVKGKSGAVRVDLGGRRSIKKNKNIQVSININSSRTDDTSMNKY